MKGGRLKSPLHFFINYFTLSIFYLRFSKRHAIKSPTHFFINYFTLSIFYLRFSKRRAIKSPLLVFINCFTLPHYFLKYQSILFYLFWAIPVQPYNLRNFFDVLLLHFLFIFWFHGF